MPLLYYIVWCCEKLKFLHISFLKTAHFVFAIIFGVWFLILAYIECLICNLFDY